MAVRCGCQVVPKAQWHKQRFSFEGRSFYRTKIMQLFHNPIGFRKGIEKLRQEIGIKEYRFAESNMVLLKDGLFSGKLMIEIIKPRFFDPSIYTFDKTTLHSFVTEEPFDTLQEETARFRKRLDAQVNSIDNIYFWQTTCPECANIQGYQTVIFFEESES